jgi:hypothetical protein
MSTMDEDGYATVSSLTESRLEEQDYVLEETGQRIRIRPLSRLEVLQAQKLRDVGIPEMEQHMLRCAMVRPVLRDADVKAWQAATPAGDLEPLTRYLNRISGLNKGADTETYERFRGGSEPGVRSLPGAETEQDGGRTTGVDE